MRARTTGRGVSTGVAALVVAGVLAACGSGGGAPQPVTGASTGDCGFLAEILRDGTPLDQLEGVGTIEPLDAPGATDQRARVIDPQPGPIEVQEVDRSVGLPSPDRPVVVVAGRIPISLEELRRAVEETAEAQGLERTSLGQAESSGRLVEYSAGYGARGEDLSVSAIACGDVGNVVYEQHEVSPGTTGACADPSVQPVCEEAASFAEEVVRGAVAGDAPSPVDVTVDAQGKVTARVSVSGDSFLMPAVQQQVEALTEGGWEWVDPPPCRAFGTERCTNPSLLEVPVDRDTVLRFRRAGTHATYLTELLVHPVAGAGENDIEAGYELTVTITTDG